MTSIRRALNLDWWLKYAEQPLLLFIGSAGEQKRWRTKRSWLLWHRSCITANSRYENLTITPMQSTAFPCRSDVHRLPNLSTTTFFSCSFRDSDCRHVNLLFVQLSVVCLRKPRRYLLTFLVEKCVHLAVSAKDTEGSKSAFVASASALEKWSSLTGFSEQIKGLWFLICRYFSSQHRTVMVSFNFFFCITIGLDACEEVKKENF